MRVSTNFTLPLATLLLGLLLVPPAALAGTTDCPVEPASGTAFATGDAFAGPNCTIYNNGDVDSFVFNANNGDIYQLAVGINSVAAAATNICLTLYNPSAVQIYSGCTSINWPNYQNSVATSQTLTASGTYTMLITETSSTRVPPLNYVVSLERIYPFPPNGQQVNLGVRVPGNINLLTDSNAFTFESVTTGTYLVSATLPGNASTNLCLTVFLTNGTPLPYNCTSIDWPNYNNTAHVQFTPPQNGSSMAFLGVAGNDGIATYNLEVSCVVGTCTQDTRPLTKKAP
jgi:hypothetical protein